MFAVVDAYKQGLLAPKQWSRNIVSGLVVGVVALPLAMAFAIASGVAPEQGIYTSIIAGVCVSLFGGSRIQVAGPTGAFIVILSGIVQQHGISGLQIATVLAGIILIALGLSKMGSIIRYIPDPVIIGFTSGIGVIIWVGQWREFFGLNVEVKGHFHEKIYQLLSAFPSLHWPTFAVGIISLILVLLPNYINRLAKIPGPLIALVIMTTTECLMPMEGVRTIGSAFGGIPRSLPNFSVPDFSLSNVITLIGPAFAIAMLGAIESLLSAVVADGMADTRHNSNQELVGQGIANMIAPFFGGIAATGAIARTATNVRNGATSPLSGVVHSLTLVVILLALAPLASSIPLATLSAVLFVVAWNMSEVKHFVKVVKRAPRADVVILLVTFLLTVFADLVVAVNIGVIVAILQFVRRMASSVEVKADDSQDLDNELSKLGYEELPGDVVVYALDGPVFFAAVESFEQTMRQIQEFPRVIILRLKWVPFIDITGLQSLEEIITNFQRRGIKVVVSGPNNLVETKLERAKIVDLLGDKGVYKEFGQALSENIAVQN
ncbi:SulP family inorganic anion transporter [Vibrio salinus]|uniref:SulP family inorganic anion transporter n=1 Tax=Vibrio salinus TaxID=2899784 RepID=UPI001E28DCD8|nr:SulP family inorganic anion transporter [Vibrio salinus]MCE0495872.1 STAS domain-containing protein [Vibrio salinus]